MADCGQDQQPPKIGVFTTDRPITLTMADNGGWIVTQGGEDTRVYHKNIGAYTSASDMIAALHDALVVKGE